MKQKNRLCVRVTNLAIALMVIAFLLPACSPSTTTRLVPEKCTTSSARRSEYVDALVAKRGTVYARYNGMFRGTFPSSAEQEEINFLNSHLRAKGFVPTAERESADFWLAVSSYKYGLVPPFERKVMATLYMPVRSSSMMIEHLRVLLPYRGKNLLILWKGEVILEGNATEDLEKWERPGIRALLEMWPRSTAATSHPMSFLGPPDQP